MRNGGHANNAMHLLSRARTRHVISGTYNEDMTSFSARAVHAIGPRSLASRPLSRLLLGTVLALAGAAALAAPPSAQPSSGPQIVVPNMGQWEEHGGFDGSRMLSTWEQNGVSPEQAFELINVMVWTQSPTITNSSSVRHMAEQQQRATQDIMSVVTPRNAEFFLRNNNMERLVERNLVSQTEAVNSPSGFGKTWNDVHSYWSSLSNASVETSSVSWSAAHAKLSNAVQEAGLEQLKIPLPMWNNPADLIQLADKIMSANHELQQVTKWSGSVLGLNGRLGLFVGSPVGNAYAYRDQSGSIMMSGDWSDIAHEWSHGLSEVLKTSSPQLSQVLSTPMEHHQGAWKHNHQSHVHELQKQGEHATAAYISNPEEMMAYSWGSFVQSQLSAQNVLYSGHTKSDMADGQRGPLVAEAAQMSGQWSQALSTIQTGWWEQQSTPAPLLSMSSIVSKRALPASHPNPALAASKY